MYVWISRGSRIENRITVFHRLQAFPIHRSRNVVAHLRHAVPGVEGKGDVEGKVEVGSKGGGKGTTLDRRAVLLQRFRLRSLVVRNDACGKV
jgi:hypothetical protein